MKLPGWLTRLLPAHLAFGLGMGSTAPTTEVLYWRGVRRVEGSVRAGADYRREGAGYVFHAKLAAGDILDRDVWEGGQYRRELYRLRENLAANTVTRIPWGPHVVEPPRETWRQPPDPAA